MGDPELLDNLQREKYQVTSTSLDMHVANYISPFKAFLISLSTSTSQGFLLASLNIFIVLRFEITS